MKDSSQGQQSNSQTTHGGPQEHSEPHHGPSKNHPTAAHCVLASAAESWVSLFYNDNKKRWTAFSEQFILSLYMTNENNVWDTIVRKGDLLIEIL